MTRRTSFLAMIDRKGWVFLALLALAAVLVPAANLLLPSSSPLHVPTHAVALMGQIPCLRASSPFALDLVWGYCGFLSLGHAAFFALGGDVDGTFTSCARSGLRGVYAHPVLPDFMVFLNWKELPWYWLRVRLVPLRGRDGAGSSPASWPSSSAGSAFPAG